MSALQEENEDLVAGMREEMEARADVAAQLEAARAGAAQLAEAGARLAAQLAEQRASLEANTAKAKRFCTPADAAAARDAIAAGLAGKDAALVADPELLAEWFAPASVQSKLDRLQKKIAAGEREAGGTLEDLQHRLGASEARMRTEGKEFADAINACTVIKAGLSKRYAALARVGGVGGRAAGWWLGGVVPCL